MNWLTQFLQTTCPQGLANCALDAFVRPFLQDGHIFCTAFVVESVSSVNFIDTSVCKE